MPKLVRVIAVVALAAPILVLLPMVIWPPMLGPLPAPRLGCSAPSSWHGLVPGLSTIGDALQALGPPAGVGHRPAARGWVLYLAYPVYGGVVARFSQDRIFVRPDGVVAWIEVTRADRDGRFYPAAEVINRLGKSMDTAYINSTYDPTIRAQYDVRSGPDQLYIWSECGMALDVLASCVANDAGALDCPSDTSTNGPVSGVSGGLTFREEAPFLDAPLDWVRVTPDNAVMMEFLFPPTTYQGFVDNYKYMIPFGLWEDYGREIGRR